MVLSKQGHRCIRVRFRNSVTPILRTVFPITTEPQLHESPSSYDRLTKRSSVGPQNGPQNPIRLVEELS